MYMELGSTFGQLVITEPIVCARLLGQILMALEKRSPFSGERIPFGMARPNGRSKRSRRFQIPEELQDKYHYPALTKGSESEKPLGSMRLNYLKWTSKPNERTCRRTISATSKWPTWMKAHPQATTPMDGLQLDSLGKIIAVDLV
ncbi:MAG: hypothetical protein R3B95_21115 [Nitrospirales bacterium]|nr:hypothetical protein [Nitrospirales bacterium]